MLILHFKMTISLMCHKCSSIPAMVQETNPVGCPWGFKVNVMIQNVVFYSFIKGL